MGWIEEAAESREEFLRVIRQPSNKWKPFGTHLNVKIFAQPYPDSRSSINVFLGCREFPYNAKVLCDIIYNLSDLKEVQKIDASVTELVTLEEINENLRVVYAAAALPIVWDRDMLYTFSRDALTPEENDSVPGFIVWCKSTIHDSRPIGKRAKTLRIDIGIAGYKFEPSDGLPLEQSRRTKVTRVVHADPNGSIPSIIINNQAKQQVSGMLEWLSKQAVRLPRAKL